MKKKKTLRLFFCFLVFLLQEAVQKRRRRVQ